MNIIRYPEKEQWKSITARPHLDVSSLNATVASILADVKRRGDQAVKEYEERFDHAMLTSIGVTAEEMTEAETLVTDELKEAIELAHHNIKVFHEEQQFRGCRVDTQPGVTCWQKSVAIERVGLYIRWYRTTVQHCVDACHTGKDSRM